MSKKEKALRILVIFGLVISLGFFFDPNIFENIVFAVVGGSILIAMFVLAINLLREEWIKLPQREKVKFLLTTTIILIFYSLLVIFFRGYFFYLIIALLTATATMGFVVIFLRIKRRKTQIGV